jgi:hypothetical protein
MFFDSHLDIQPYELAHMPMSKGILSSEDRSDLVNSLEVTHNTHLLVKLRGLSQACFSIEVTKSEDIRTTF